MSHFASGTRVEFDLDIPQETASGLCGDETTPVSGEGTSVPGPQDSEAEEPSCPAATRTSPIVIIVIGMAGN